MAVNLAAVRTRQVTPPPQPPKPVKQTKAQQKAAQAAEQKAKTAKVMADLKVVPEWDSLPALKKYRYHPDGGKVMDFDDMCEKLAQLSSEISFRELQKKELQREIELAMAEAGADKVEWEDRPVTMVHSRSASTVDPHLLLEKGVSPDVIAAATVEGREYSYPLIGRVPKSKESSK